MAMWHLQLICLSQSGSSSRANDDFNDGMAKEYSVHDATLLFCSMVVILKGKSSFVEAHTLSTAPWKNAGTSTDNITTQSTKIVQKVTKSGAVDSVCSRLFNLSNT